MLKNNLKEFWVMKEPVGVIYQQLMNLHSDSHLAFYLSSLI